VGLKLDKTTSPRKCTACGVKKSFPVIEETAAGNTSIELAVVEASENRKIREIGGFHTKIFICSLCGKVDLYIAGAAEG
jgi:hypothetical protein